jgi:hypothetical protein
MLEPSWHVLTSLILLPKLNPSLALRDQSVNSLFYTFSAVCFLSLSYTCYLTGL